MCTRKNWSTPRKLEPFRNAFMKNLSSPSTRTWESNWSDDRHCSLSCLNPAQPSELSYHHSCVLSRWELVGCKFVSKKKCLHAPSSDRSTAWTSEAESVATDRGVEVHVLVGLVHSKRSKLSFISSLPDFHVLRYWQHTKVMWQVWILIAQTIASTLSSPWYILSETSLLSGSIDGSFNIFDMARTISNETSTFQPLLEKKYNEEWAYFFNL